MSLRTVSLLLLAGCLAAVPAVAQPLTFDGCVDYLGRPVASVPNDYLPDVARAFLAPNGQPVIEYNRHVLDGLSRQSRLFWYGHECGHHALGHNFGRSHPLHVEQEADCFGIVTLVREGLLDLGDVRIVQRELARSPGDWTHLPGPQRSVNLEACLEDAGLTRRRGRDRDPSRGRRGRSGRSERSERLYCCDVYGNRYCPIVANPGPVGTACGCSGLPGWGVICR
jgi:hypothetical protein